MDAAIVGGLAVTDIIAGKVAESQIPSDVLAAFHAQYPQLGSSFVDEVHHFSGHPDKLAGLINGVKGKLFEIDYVQWLNHGHLRTGWIAELAHQANNPGWDIAIHDSHGHLDEVLQLKATESLAYVREAIAAHPDIDVVVTHDLYERLTDHPEMLSHVVDRHYSMDYLTDHVTSAADHAEAGANHFHVPFLAIAFAACQNYSKYWKGKTTLRQALQDTGERGMLSVIASAAGWAAFGLAHSTLVGIPVSMAIRLGIAQVRHNRGRRSFLTESIERVVSSTRALENLIQRPVLYADGGSKAGPSSPRNSQSQQMRSPRSQPRCAQKPPPAPH